METYITIRKFALWPRKLNQGLCTNLEGGMGREMGRRLRREGICAYLYGEVWQKTAKF